MTKNRFVLATDFERYHNQRIMCLKDFVIELGKNNVWHFSIIITVMHKYSVGTYNVQ